MKILIKESRLTDTILLEILNYYNWDNIVTEDDEDGDGLFFGDDEGDLFYYNREEKTLEIYDGKFWDYMTGFFNDLWFPIFNRFIEYKYDITIKEIS